MSNEWENEKVYFYRFKTIDNNEMRLCTSASKYENELKERFCGKKLT